MDTETISREFFYELILYIYNVVGGNCVIVFDVEGNIDIDA